MAIQEDQYSLNTFLNYGESNATLDAEIKADVYRVIKQSVTSTFFNRSDGSGIELLENEGVTFESFILLTLQIVNNMSNYNATASADRQILFSQETIEITEGKFPGELYIYFRYLPQKNVSSGNSTFSSVSVPIGG